MTYAKQRKPRAERGAWNRNLGHASHTKPGAHGPTHVAQDATGRRPLGGIVDEANVWADCYPEAERLGAIASEPLQVSWLAIHHDAAPSQATFGMQRVALHPAIIGSELEEGTSSEGRVLVPAKVSMQGELLFTERATALSSALLREGLASI